VPQMPAGLIPQTIGDKDGCIFSTFLASHLCDRLFLLRFAALHSVADLLPLTPWVNGLQKRFALIADVTPESRVPVSLISFAPYGPGCVRTVKLTSTGGTAHPCNDGQPGSLVELRHSDAVALLISDGSTAPFSGSA
jgi:hypothetical protein